MRQFLNKLKTIFKEMLEPPAGYDPDGIEKITTLEGTLELPKTGTILLQEYISDAKYIPFSQPGGSGGQGVIKVIEKDESIAVINENDRNLTNAYRHLINNLEENEVIISTGIHVNESQHFIIRRKDGSTYKKFIQQP